MEQDPSGSCAGVGDAIASANAVKNDFRQCDYSGDGTIPRDVLAKILNLSASTLDLDILFVGYAKWSETSLDSAVINYSLFTDWVFGVTIRFFTSHQHTNTANARIASWLESFEACVASAKASVPPFNTRLNVDLRPGTVCFNLPTYGVRLPRAVMSIFDIQPLIELSQELGIPIPRYSLDTFVQKKMAKVMDLVDAASNRVDCASGQNQLAVQRLRAFVEEFRELKSGVTIKSPEDFCRFVEQHVPPGWEDRLHFDHLLSSNFGFEEQTAAELRDMTIKFEDKGEIKEEKAENYSLRWLGKAFKGYGPVGCLTDVVNLIYAMTSPYPPEVAEEKIVTSVVEQFKLRLDSKDFQSLWIPSHIVHDAEVDDSLVWLLLEYVHRLQGTELHVMVQLPPGDTFDSLEGKVRAHAGSRCTTFRDPDSGNSKPIKSTWSDFMK